ncbi:MAG: NAD(P)-dependent oxidoreductase [Planctomycetota bacterium]|jgi:3-hydroxyisobutyrate dehydrogenase-like beta-hydroxyacid dehydrogenase
MSNKVGLVGLGLVGTAIAESLLSQDYEVIGFDIDPQRCQQLEKSGGKLAASPADVASRVERLILSLPETNAVLQVVEGAGGILEAKSSPAHIIDTTTGDPDETISLATRLAERGIAFLDSTISGSSKQVRERKAVFMVGGDRAAFEQCRDVFSALTEKVFYVGPSGSGSKAKLAGNAWRLPRDSSSPKSWASILKHSSN